MDGSSAVLEGMKLAGIDLVTSVPCVNLRTLLELIDSDESIVHIPVTREEEGVGICAGAYMGGKRPALLMQNSGLGNSITALASLNLLYESPLIMIVSHRGVEGEWIEAQKPMGALTEPLLDVMGIGHCAPQPEEASEVIAREIDSAFNERRPRAILLNIAFWRKR